MHDLDPPRGHESVTATPSGPESGDRSRTRRRALLTAISAAGVAGTAKLPAQWSRPVVDHAVLPVHAQTTTEEPGGGATGTSGSTFVTTVTSECAITCTSGNYSASTFEPNSDFYRVFSEAGAFTICIDQSGATSSTLVSVTTGELHPEGPSITTNSTFFVENTASFSDSELCNVTTTSS